MTDDLLVSVRNVRKTYGMLAPVPALQDVSLDLKPSEHIAILGPNGAGKSTLLKLLLGVARPTAGTIRWSSNAQPSIGFAPERPRLLPRTTVREYLELAAGRNAASAKAIEECEFGLQLSTVMHRRVEGLSKGEAQRVSLAFAFLCDAPVVVLDEPFEGLDPMIRPLARAFILGALARKEHCTFIATTHRLEEVREPFERVLVINGGVVVQDLSLATFRELASGSVLILPGDSDAADIRQALAARGLTLSGMRAVRGTYRDAIVVLIGPFPRAAATDEDFHPLDFEVLLQLWLQPSAF